MPDAGRDSPSPIELGCRTEDFAKDLAEAMGGKIKTYGLGARHWIHDHVSGSDPGDVRIWDSPHQEYKQEWRKNPPETKIGSLQEYPKWY